MSIEEQLKERLNFHWKGFREYDELEEYEKYDLKKAYSIQELYNAMKEAYNLGIEIAANNVTTKTDLSNPYDVNSAYEVIDRDSILKFKIL